MKEGFQVDVYGKHFTVDGVDSRDYYLVTCSFNGTQNDEISMGLGMEPITTELRNRTIDYGGKWKDKIKYKVSVTHGCGREGEPFDHEEIRELARLFTGNRDMKWISFYDENDVEYFYYGRFADIHQKKVGGVTVGLILDVECDSPFAYSDIKEVVVADGANYSVDNTFGYKYKFGYNLYTNTDEDIIFNVILQINPDEDGIFGRDDVIFSITHYDNDSTLDVELPYYQPYGSTMNVLNMMLDMQNYILGEVEENHMDYKRIFSQPISLSNDKFELHSGRNNIQGFFSCHQSISTIENYKVILQYREKYKVGVF